MFKKLKNYLQNCEQDFQKIEPNRRTELEGLADYFSKKFQKKETPQVIVICTHNSRRSHLGQIWLAAAADFYGLPRVETFSGGTEATAFFPAAVEALRGAGFKIENETPTAANPIYKIRWRRGGAGLAAFSKTFDDAANPQKNFAAVLVCKSADEACPVVFGADFRLPLPYDDPKISDETPFQKEKYAERCHEIARDMLWVMRNAQV